MRILVSDVPALAAASAEYTGRSEMLLEPNALVNVEQGHCQYRDQTSAAMSCWEQFEAYKN
jgi:hypothetical protein